MANIDELKSTGLKATLPRLKILEIFQQGGLRHMTSFGFSWKSAPISVWPPCTVS